MTRKLASVQRIVSLNPIPNADNIEVAKVLGWNVVVKKNEFQVNDLCIYLEIDSFVPSTVAPFLTKPEHFPKQFNGVEGERLRTVKLRGQISQGLVLPLTVLNTKYNEHELHEYWNEGDDVSELLEIVKWEPPISPQLAGQVKGSFPGFLHKTDEERVQNLPNLLKNYEGTEMYITEKLDGSSLTIYKHDGVFGVCSRNLELKETEGNSQWQIARRLNLEEKLPDGYAVQGEIVGPNIQGNPLKLTDLHYFIYNVYSINEGKYLSYNDFVQFCSERDLPTVPVLNVGHKLRNSIDYYIELADDRSTFGKSINREGIVIRPLVEVDDPFQGRLSFKAISNRYLLKNDG